MKPIEEAKKVFDIEIDALIKTRASLGDAFLRILDEIVKCKGKVIVTGMGKPGHIGKKIAATFSSLGTSSFYLHPAEATHGDLGMIENTDIVLVISYSGESDEIVRILPVIKAIGAKIIALTGNSNSTLTEVADIVQVFPSFDEACHLGLAPTSSTTAELVYGDALAVVASIIYGFQDEDFGLLHPAGSLGKRLFLRVGDLMVTGDRNAVVSPETLLKDVILEISKKELGMTSVVDNNGKLLGIITSGDIRRLFQSRVNLDEQTAIEVLQKTPICANPNDKAIDILNKMTEADVNRMPVVENGILVGTLKLSDLIKSGLVVDSL